MFLLKPLDKIVINEYNRLCKVNMLYKVYFCFGYVMELTDKIFIGELVLTYGNLLTKKQLDAVNCYYLYDMSLSEIAENENISRQGAYDLVTKSTAILTSTEEKLGVVKQKRKVNNLISELINEIEIKSVKQKLEEIKNILG